MNTSEIKRNIKKNLFENLNKINGVLSITIVGSFINKKNLSGISDIDTVVISDNLNKGLFDSCLNAVENIDLKKCGLENFSLKINSTFGPLKYDSSNLAVVHLMIYDLKGHRSHVINSPFTCFDWERSKTNKGLDLKEIFPVGRLQFRDFTEVRRSIENYIQDLKDNIISYREYDFHEKDVVEIKKKKPLDRLHQGEYAYHIVRNLLANYLKLCNNRNDSFTESEIKSEIKRIFRRNGDKYVKRYDQITIIKSQRSENYPADTINWVQEFIDKFQGAISSEWKDAVPIYFLRHYKTNSNDGTYLGQGRDPGIDKLSQSYPNCQKVTQIYSSPMRRCIETAHKIWKDQKIKIDDKLIEINYGQAEGLVYNKLAKRNPEIIKAWDSGDDPCFPDGENTDDVFKRLKYFLKSIEKKIKINNKGSFGIVSHNVVLRCLIGDAFGLDKKNWYKLVIPHGVPLEFLYRDNQFYPNIPREIWDQILQNIGYSLT